VKEVKPTMDESDLVSAIGDSWPKRRESQLINVSGEQLSGAVK
jgi:hypothetical protein